MVLPIERLDRSRPYGEVYGEAQHNVKYTQKSLGLESWPYDNHGQLIEKALTPEQKKKLEQKRIDAKKAPPVEVKPEEEEQLYDEELAAATRRESDDNDDVNFELWLKGEAKYKPNDLQRAAQKRYGVNKPQTRELARYLVEDAKLMPRSLVDPSILPPLPV